MKIPLLGLILILSVSLCFGQETNDEPRVIEDKSTACENVPASLDAIIMEAVNKQEKVIAIFRASKNETEIVNANRLNFVKWHLENYRKRPQVIIYARGEKSENQGKIEFYVSGKLRLVIMSPHNKTPCLDCCGNLIDYPQILTKKHRPGKRTN